MAWSWGDHPCVRRRVQRSNHLRVSQGCQGWLRVLSVDITPATGSFQLRFKLVLDVNNDKFKGAFLQQKYIYEYTL